ncbi:MAG: fasciclin domain-containing protein [Planctomycetes bacterium]|nr:fasciclin domain-containing protein [Planctomycetota bacterium]
MRFQLQGLLGAVAAPVLALGLFTAPVQAQAPNLVQTAVANGNFTTLVAALQATGLDVALSGTDRFTVFAPTDAAFAALPPGTVQTLLQPENLATLSTILRHHVVVGGKFSSQVLAGPTLDTLSGQRVDVSVVGGQPKVDAANLVITDIVASNGIIHVIDAVLLPSLQNIPQTAAAAGSFNTLLTAVTAANLAGVLSSEGPFTVFAPTDAAFAPLPVLRLLEPVNIPRLANILTYHVVAGRVYSDQLQDGQIVPTVNGQTLLVTKRGSNVFANGIPVVAADIEAWNGNIHVLSGVLLPPIF